MGDWAEGEGPELVRRLPRAKWRHASPTYMAYQVRHTTRGANGIKQSGRAKQPPPTRPRPPSENGILKLGKEARRLGRDLLVMMRRRRIHHVLLSSGDKYNTPQGVEET